MLRMILSATDDSWLVVGWQAHRLRPVEFRVLKCSQPEQTVAKSRGKVVLGEIDLIRENQFEALGQRPQNGRFLVAARWWRCPGSLIILLSDCCAYSNDPSLGFRLAHQGFDSRPAQPPHRREKGPL